jgi:hypothetical protein
LKGALQLQVARIPDHEKPGKKKPGAVSSKSPPPASSGESVDILVRY